jgi:hypothetical protein
LAPRIAVGSCEAAVEVSFPKGILLGETEKLEGEAVVSAFDNEGTADVVENAISVDVDVAVDVVIDVDCGWDDDARAWAEIGS